MNNFLRVGLWNANGLANHSQEIKLFLSTHKLDIMLVSETHFTNANFFKIPNYNVYCTNHPDNTAHGGSAVIIRNNISHYELPKFCQPQIQATSVMVEDWAGPLSVSAVYCPPRHNISNQLFSDFFISLGPRFITGGDFNAKHVMWGSRLVNPRGRNLLKCVDDNNFNYLSAGEPTYWPTDPNKLPDLLDFFVTRGISQNYLNVTSSLDLSSDHSPVILTLSSTITLRECPPLLTNKRTDWDLFRDLVNSSLNLKIPLKNREDLDSAIEIFNSSIQTSAWKSTPTCSIKTSTHINYPMEVKQKIAEKRRLRRVWQNSRNQADKTNFNRASRQLKRLLYKLKNCWFQEFTANLSPTETTNYSLWKVTKSIKQPLTPIPPISKPDGSWAKSNIDKANIFAEYFSDAFKPNPVDANFDISPEVEEFLDSPNQLSLPITPFKATDIKSIIVSDLSCKKAPGYDLITGKVLKELPRKAIIFLTMLFNSVLRMEYFPAQWKVAQIVVLPKPGKPANQVTSYRPISLLPIVSKVFEKLFLKRLEPLINSNNLIPNHQFGFRRQHSTIEQVHRIVNVITQVFESKKFCSSVFLDVSQAFDKVWHSGLLFKLKSVLPHSFFNIIKSYLSDRLFQIKFQDVLTDFKSIESGVPQGSVLGPVLYVIFTADLPTSAEATIATFADDTAILASHSDSFTASRILQSSLDSISEWMKRWRIKVNESKSVHVTFTLRFETCPTVLLNNVLIPTQDSVKYLGIHLDRRLTWKTHIWNKRLQLNTKLSKMSWLLGKRSHLSLESKLILYKVVFKPIWTYGIQLWGSASTSNINIIQRFQSKFLRLILKAPWYIRNDVIHNDTKIPTVNDEVKRFSHKYIVKLEAHVNDLAVNLLDNSEHIFRLRREDILNLPHRHF
jgi:hypothetical protein